MTPAAGPGTDSRLERGAPALFADRDGTIVVEREYLADPGGLELIEGAAEGLRRFQEAGYRIVVVTNQSGIARGYYDEAAYARVERALDAILAEAGVEVAGTYHCPHHPAFTGACDCRKPATGLFERAAAELGLDPGASIYVGDRLRDVEPAFRLGGRPVLVRTGYGAREAEVAPAGVLVVDDLAAAADHVLVERGR